MRTVGTILRETREKKGLTLPAVEASTKIRKKYLEAMEDDQYNRLPSPAYAKGFVKNYSEYLGLNSKNMIAFFRRQIAEVPKSSLLPKGVADPLNKPVFRLTPGNFLAFILFGMVTMVLGYFGLQYQKLQQPPELVIESPKEQTVTSERRIDILGKTDPDATVTVNSVSVLVRSDGQFFDQIQLIPGVNKITILATSRYGKTNTVTREVAFQEPQ